MNLDALFNHSRDSLASARKSLYDLLEELRGMQSSDYSSVADVITSITKAEEELDGLAAHWQEEAEKKMHGEGMSGMSLASKMKMVPMGRLYEDKGRPLDEILRTEELSFDKFLPDYGEDE